jgi:hypothetical protein
MVCATDWESRHAQELIRVKPDSVALPWTQTENDGIDVGPALNCEGLTFEDMSATTFTTFAATPLTVYKLRITGTPAVITSTTTVLCELRILG